ncbi:MAG: hypothetical protein ACFFBQ_19780 [Promethearchaeota archaeon]
MSWYMLTHQVRTPNMISSSLVQEIVPNIPFKEKDSFNTSGEID